MNIIKFFKEIRRDGKVIDEKTTVEDMLAKGWGAEKIVAIKWRYGKDIIEIKNEDGILAKVVEDASAVVGKFYINNAGVLKVINPDGTLRFAISNIQRINEEYIDGVYEWFEYLDGMPESSFSIVFKDKKNDNLFVLSIDANTGELLSANRTM